MGIFSEKQRGFSAKDMVSIRAELAAQKAKAGGAKPKASWTINRGAGPRAMSVPRVVPIPATRPKPQSVAAPATKSRRTFSSAKAASKTKIPSYTSVPAFAKNYQRVPARKFIYDLSDANLTRTFGPATTGTPKAKDTLPMVNLPTIAKSEPKPSVINSPQPEVKALGSGFKFGTAAAITTGAALGLGTAAAVAISGREPRVQHDRRKPTGRRQTNMPHPFGEAIGVASEKRGTSDRRTAAGPRRDPEHAITGSKRMRGQLKVSQANYDAMKNATSQIDRAIAAEKAAGIEKLPAQERVKSPRSTGKPRRRKAGTMAPAPASATPAQTTHTQNVIANAAATAKVTPPVRHGIRGNFKGPDTATAAINALPDKPKPRLRKAGTPKPAEVPAKSLEPKPTPAPVVIESGGQPQTTEQRIKANEARQAEIERELAKKSGVTSGSSSSAPAAPKLTGEVARLAEKQAKDDAKTKGYRYRGQPFPKNRGTADRVRESAPIVDPNPHEMREQAKGRKVKRARRQDPVRKGETTVGSSQSLTQGIKALENQDRNKALAAHIKKHGVTKLPPATKEMMEPEKIELKVPTIQPGHGRLPPKKTTAPIAEAATITSRDDLLAQIEKASKENQALGGKGTKISTTGDIKATGKIRVRKSKAAQAKAAMEAKPPIVVSKSGLRKAGTPAPGATGTTTHTQNVIANAAATTKTKLRKAGTPKKLGVAAIVGAGVGATMAGSEAKADSGSYTAAAKAAGASLYNDAREIAKFAMGAKIATKLPGAAGAAARFGLGRILPGIGVAATGYSLAEMATEGYGAFRAKRDADRQKAYAKEKYGSVAKATATRHARERAKGLRK